MLEQADCMEVFLQPGEFYFTGGYTRIRTLLGSCVAVTLWHPERRIGGMSHYLLPSRAGGHGTRLDGRYGDESIRLFLREIHEAGTSPGDYQAKIFGGGNMFADRRPAMPLVGARNVAAAQEMLARYGIRTVAASVGDEGYRKIAFELWSGDVWVNHAKQPVRKLAGSEG
jgi:chemotaxis protein CheD